MVQTALVTGGNGGVGSAVVRVLAESGVRVAAAVRSHRAEVPDPVGGWTVAFDADVTDEDSVERLFTDAHAALGRIDLVVNTVGGFLPASLLVDLRASDWDRMMTLNLRSTFLCTREAIRTMRPAGRGVIVNFSAMAGLEPMPGRIAYAVAKSGVDLLTRVVAEELRGTGIAVYVLAPAVIGTEANRSSGSTEDQAKRVTPEEIAETILALANGTTGASGSTIRLGERP
jgi:NAD(P)-dependent dehydrogenase (short-subunit alcohol dehydrogenase family)